MAVLQLFFLLYLPVVTLFGCIYICHNIEDTCISNADFIPIITKGGEIAYNLIFNKFFLKCTLATKLMFSCQINSELTFRKR